MHKKDAKKAHVSTPDLAAFSHLILCSTVLSLFYVINILCHKCNDRSLHQVVDVENTILSFCLVQIE